MPPERCSHSPTTGDWRRSITPTQPKTVATRLSEPLSAGRNMQISRADDRTVFVPQPTRERVAAVELAGLRQVGDIDAGPAPAHLSEDSGMRVLLALSSDGATVTPIEEVGLRKLPGARVSAGHTGAIDGANRGRAIEYHVYGPGGLSYYKGSSSPPPQRGHYGARVFVTAGDGAATGVTVFESATFTGYPHASIAVLRVLNYRAGLPSGPARSASLSGMAIGPDRIYLTLRGQPVLVSVAKPPL